MLASRWLGAGWIACVALIPLAATAAPPTVSTYPTARLKPTRFLGRPLSLLLEEWNDDADLTMGVRGTLTPQKVTVVTPADTDTRIMMPAVAALLHAKWVTSRTNPKQWRLERVPEVEQALAAYPAIRQRLEKQAHEEQSAELTRALARALDAIDKPPIPGDGGMLGRPYVHEGSEPLVRLVASLPKSQQDHLFNSWRPIIPNGESSWAADVTPALSAPFRSLTGDQQRWVREALKNKGSPVDPSDAVVQLENLDGTQIFLSFVTSEGSIGGFSIFDSHSGKAWQQLKRSIRHGESFVPDRYTATLAGGTPQKEVLKRVDQMHPQRITLKWEELDYADAIRALSELLEKPVVADYYTRRERLSLNLKNAPASEVVQRLLEQFGGIAAWKGDVLLVRSRRWPTLDTQEIPDELLRKWVQRKQELPKDTLLPLEDLAAAATVLTVLQRQTLDHFVDRTSRINLVDESVALRQDQDVLQFIGTLSATQRGALFERGIAVGSLPEHSRGAALALLQRRASWLVEQRDVARTLIRLRLVTREPPGTSQLEISKTDNPAQLAVQYPTLVVPPLRESGHAPVGGMSP